MKYQLGVLGRELDVFEDLGVFQYGRQVRPVRRGDLLSLSKLNGGKFDYLRLSGLDMTNIDLRGLRIESAHLTGVDLTGAIAMPMVTLDTGELPIGDGLYEVILDNWSKGEMEQFVQDISPTVLVGSLFQQANMSNADLRWTDFQNVFCPFGVFDGANLFKAILKGANLTGTSLVDTNLREADLRDAVIERSVIQDADLRGANLVGTRLVGTRIKTQLLSGVCWESKYLCPEEADRKFDEAEQVYRTLKQAHQDAGESELAGQFHYREWECKRKRVQQTNSWWRTLEYWLHRLLSGYGERPERVIISGAVVILFFALWYLPYAGPFCSSPGCWAAFGKNLGEAIYFSGVSFTALGYGDWVHPPSNWTRYLGVIESLVGISLIALFLVTFTRKMTR